MDAVDRTLSVTPFDGQDFAAWKFRVETLLDEKDLLDHIRDTTSKDTATIPDPTAWARNDKKAKSLIVKCVANSHIDYLRDKNTAYEMWKTHLSARVWHLAYF